ncbi:MAG: hypothetical protein JWM11_5836 [Planctomycetaceae bacterium]|nr:hypothetical protein [Planctomycetaceae bacterium]
MRYIFVLIACLCVNSLLPLFLGVDGKTESLPATVTALLDSSSEFTLYSLEPAEKPEKDVSLHDWKVLGKTTVKEPAERAKLLTALKKSVGQKGDRAKCFYPRHAVSTKFEGKQIDLLICFQCGWVQVLVDGKYLPDDIETDKTAQKTLDEILSAAKVPLARKSQK